MSHAVQVIPRKRKNEMFAFVLPEYDLDSADGIRRMLKEVIKAGWSGSLGSRTISALDTSLNLLLEHTFYTEVNARLDELESAEKKRRAQRQVIDSEKLRETLEITATQSARET